MNYFKHQSDLKSAVNWNSTLTCGDYGFLMLLMEFLSTLEGNRLALNDDDIKALSDHCEMSFDMTKRNLEKLIEHKIVQHDGLGVWSKYLDGALELSSNRSKSASNAAKARWEKARAKKQEKSWIEEDNFELISLDDVPQSVSVVVYAELLELIGEDNSTITKDKIVKKDSKVTEYIQFFEDSFNAIRKSALPNSRTVLIATNEKAIKRLKLFYTKKVTMDDLEVVILNAFDDSNHKENAFKYVTMDFLLRDEIFNRYVAMDRPKHKAAPSKEPKGPAPEITVRNM